MRSFVGFCNYYRRFVKDFAQIARPLHELTKKNARFEWTPCCQIAFDRLRLELATAPVLQFARYDCPFIIDTDASNVSLGALLSNYVLYNKEGSTGGSSSFEVVQTLYMGTQFCHTYRSRQLKIVIQSKCRRHDIQNAPTFATVQLRNCSSRGQ